MKNSGVCVIYIPQQQQLVKKLLTTYLTKFSHEHLLPAALPLTCSLMLCSCDVDIFEMMLLLT